MEEFPRKADGRRIFSVGFKRETVAQIVSGERTLAELSRELGISPSVLRNWMRLVERGGTTAVAAGEDVVPVSRATSCQVVYERGDHGSSIGSIQAAVRRAG